MLLRTKCESWKQSNKAVLSRGESDNKFVTEFYFEDTEREKKAEQ